MVNIDAHKRVWSITCRRTNQSLQSRVFGIAQIISGKVSVDGESLSFLFVEKNIRSYKDNNKDNENNDRTTITTMM